MKKILNLMLCLIVSITMTACSNKSKVEEIKDLGLGIKEKGNCTFYIETEGVTSENNAIPYIYSKDENTMKQIGYTAKKFDETKLSYIYIDGKLQENLKLNQDYQGTLTLQKDTMKFGKHKIEVVQYENTESKDKDDIITYKLCEYVITNNNKEFTEGNEKVKKIQSESENKEDAKVIDTIEDKDANSKSDNSNNNSNNNSNGSNNGDGELPPGGYYVTCSNCGKKCYTINGDYDCDCSGGTVEPTPDPNPDPNPNPEPNPEPNPDPNPEPAPEFE